MPSIYVFLDFEYNKTQELNLNVICVSLIIRKYGCDEEEHKSYWLLHSKDKLSFSADVTNLKNIGATFISYSVVAEASALISLFGEAFVRDMSFVDLFLEYRQLLNKNDEYAYGTQLIDGVVKETSPKSFYDFEDTGESHDKAEDNLAACVFKLLGKRIDIKEKEEVRDLIISCPKHFSEGEEERILRYCAEDTKYLPQLFDRIVDYYINKVYVYSGVSEMSLALTTRGDYARNIAIMERRGYPINVTEAKNFSHNAELILMEIQKHICKTFRREGIFEYTPRNGKYIFKQVSTRKWLKENVDTSYWPRTETGELSLSFEAFTKYFDFKHSYPEDNIGAQIVRYLKTKQSLNGFLPAKKGKKTFFDYVGSDRRCRPYTNPYGSQASRNQPGSTSFIFLKAAWMRSLVMPRDGYVLGSVDFSSEEFLIGALESGDEEMLEAYISGDVYLWFGKKCKRIPEHATKESHKELRDIFKPVVLSIQYDMTAKGLAKKIRMETGVPCSEEQAQEYIDDFEEVFWRYTEYRDEMLDQYKEDRYLKLRDGWIMWGDNNNFRSVRNFMVQGGGAVILRKAVELCLRENIRLILTNHDALILESRKEFAIRDMNKMIHCMRQAFADVYGAKAYDVVKMDGVIWGKDALDIKEEHSFKVMDRYVDGRSKEEYEKFKKYFDIGEIDL